LKKTFLGNLQGQFTRNGPDANGNFTMQFNLSINNGPPGNIQVILQGQSGGGDDGGFAITSSSITLSSSAGQQLYQGTLSNVSGERRWYMTALLTGTGSNSGRQLQVQIMVRLYSSGQASGAIAAGSAIPSGSGFPE
jgi:hypothetical protein